jgi:hypothetical protein
LSLQQGKFARVSGAWPDGVQQQLPLAHPPGPRPGKAMACVAKAHTSRTDNMKENSFCIKTRLKQYELNSISLFSGDLSSMIFGVP